MADWIKSALENLLDLKKENPLLAEQIYHALLLIEKEPFRGKHVQGTEYSYPDFQKGFRITYNFRPRPAGKIEILSISVFPPKPLI